MSNDPKTNRDAGSGKYVSQDYADQHKQTTVSETAGSAHIWKLLERLSTQGGAIVREDDLSAEDLAAAKADGRHWGGFVYVPIEE